MKGFPDHNIDPREKEKKPWILQAAQACWANSKTFSGGIFYHGRHKFREYRNYSNGRQPIDKYKAQFEPPDASGHTPEKFMQLNYDIIPFIPKFKKIALGKINKIGYNIVATAIDSLARDEEEDYFSEQKAKIRLLDELGDVPGIETMLDLGEDDPRTLEEVRIKQDYSYKHNAAIESEKGLEVVFTNNKYDQILQRVSSDLFDFGVGGVREFFDPNGKIKIKHSNMENFISSYCEEPDFSDAYYLGEVLFMGVDEIQSYGEFKPEEIEEISDLKGDARNWIRPRTGRSISTEYEDDKIAVLDFEIKSYNTKYYEKRENKFGNKEINKAKFNKRSKNEVIQDGYQVIYKGKWLIGTDFVFDCGLATDMKRKKNALKETDFSWHLMAPNQDQMQFFGITEAMIPVADMIQITWLKIQNLILNMVPPGIAFDLDALENINLGHAGQEWKPRKVLEMYRQRGDIPFRRRDKETGEYANDVPVTPIYNQVTGEIQNLANIINAFLSLMRDNVGFNEITDGSTPDPRTLNGVANLAYQSTSNALAHIVMGLKHLNENVADSIVVRLQDAFSGGNNYYLKALGINSQRFWRVQADITVHEMAIKFEDKPNDEQIATLNRRIELAEQAGQITVADSCYIDTIDNIKEKAAVLAYLVNKNLERQQAMKAQDIQLNSQEQQKSAMVSSQAKQAELQAEWKLRMQHQQQGKEWDYRIKQLEGGTRLEETDKREQGRIITKQVENQGKERIKEMDT